VAEAEGKKCADGYDPIMMPMPAKGVVSNPPSKKPSGNNNVDRRAKK